jgi:hypothetical protein
MQKRLLAISENPYLPELNELAPSSPASTAMPIAGINHR